MGKNRRILAADAPFLTVDCTRYQARADEFARALSGSEGTSGWLKRCAGGILHLRSVELLPQAAQELVLQNVAERASAEGASSTRLVCSTTALPDDPQIKPFTQRIPVIVSVPSLRDRSSEEREELVLACFKTEGRRMGRDIYVSRGAFRCLVDADFEGNVRELASCITTCCAEAYLNMRDDRVEIRAYQLPSHVLDPRIIDRGDESTELIDTARSTGEQDDGYLTQLLDAMLAAYRSHRSGASTFHDLVAALGDRMHDLEDYLVFGHAVETRKADAYERVVAELVNDVNALYGVELSRKSVRLVARFLCIQLWPNARLSRWRNGHAAEIDGLLSVVGKRRRFAASVTDHLGTGLERLLGIELEALARLMLLLHVDMTCGEREHRRSVGIVLSHGYSTATSIADAANRMLRTRVFEAIDMTYDQQVKDIIGPLRRRIERFSYCDEFVILVDMGSLEDIDKELGSVPGMTLGVINNISTGLAVEVGAGLIAGRGIADILATASEACTCRYRVIERVERPDAIAFCSENGIDAAEKIRALFAQSLDAEPPVRLVACDLRQLAGSGAGAASFGDCHVRAVIGTTDPKAPSMPYIALEDIISGAGVERIDRVLSRYLDASALARFHQNLVKNMTLRNVMESITILNPNRLFGEIDRAVSRLVELTGERIGERQAIGLYVHLCCLVERLVTHNPIDAYADERAFACDHADFIEAFRVSFSDIAERYHIEVPVTEIAYAFDYINSKHAPRKHASSHTELEALQDE